MPGTDGASCQNARRSECAGNREEDNPRSTPWPGVNPNQAGTGLKQGTPTSVTASIALVAGLPMIQQADISICVSQRVVNNTVLTADMASHSVDITLNMVGKKFPTGNLG